MIALVTGGAGFIGSHLVDLLLNEGYKVKVIDNLSNGRIDNLKQHKGNDDFELLIEDVSNYDKIEPFFKNVDWVFHLAALADIVPSIEEPMKYHNSNVDGTISVLEAAKKHGIKRLIYAASSSCYGIPEKYPTSENSPISPQYPYAFTKFIGEQYVMHWYQVYGLPVTSLRFFNVYGPRSRTSGTYGAVFGVFLAQKIAGKPFTIVGDGTQTRDFTFVTDVVKACYESAKSEKAIGQTMNVGSGNTYSVNQLVELLEGPYEFIPKRPGEPDCTFADTTKILALTNWKPQVSLENGVKEMLDNIDYWENAPVWDSKSIEKATEKWFKYLS
ncbi:MAG: SDR family oxidoreductase [Cytophagales bacterium]